MLSIKKKLNIFILFVCYETVSAYSLGKSSRSGASTSSSKSQSSSSSQKSASHHSSSPSSKVSHSEAPREFVRGYGKYGMKYADLFDNYELFDFDLAFKDFDFLDLDFDLLEDVTDTDNDLDDVELEIDLLKLKYGLYGLSRFSRNKPYVFNRYKRNRYKRWRRPSHYYSHVRPIWIHDLDFWGFDDLDFYGWDFGYDTYSYGDDLYFGINDISSFSSLDFFK